MAQNDPAYGIDKNTMSTALVWFRRDLRIADHAALALALERHSQVHCVFVFDRTILDALPRADRRVEFILHGVAAVDAGLREFGGGLMVRHGDPLDEIPRLAATLGVDAVYAGRDYEPAAIRRDEETAERLRWMTGAALHLVKDQVVFERDEVMTQAGAPFTVFTPYRNAWLKRLTAADLTPHVVALDAGTLAPMSAAERLPTLDELSFAATDLTQLRVPLGMQGAQTLFEDFAGRIDRYADTRDFPGLRGPSYLSAHLRFGTISIRQLARFAINRASPGAQTWLAELIWRDFYQAILWHFPRVVERCFKPACDALRWEDDAAGLAAWREGRTGYPLVDAAMRQLLQSGYMHNRLRMVSASFLTKDLGIDWRQGEAWFAEKLLDFDLAANNGGWQWAASTGCDAQPWFRIFNPLAQSEKFDPQGHFIRRYLPELTNVPLRHLHAPWRMSAAEQSACGVHIGTDYPAPCVDHAAARERTLQRFAALRETTRA
jgi:deoxyribodipyrimidine photo-lyase